MSVAELLEPLYVRDEAAVTTFGFRLPGFHRDRVESGRGKAPVASAPFDFGPFRWCVEVHPNGCLASAGRALSAFLVCVSKLTPSMSVLVPFSVTVLRTDGGDPGTHTVRGSVNAPDGVQAFSATTRRLGWQDLIPLPDIGSFLDKADGLILHVAFGKPARCQFRHPVARGVIGGAEVFDTPIFRLASHTWFLRMNPCVCIEGEEGEGGPFTSLHVYMEVGDYDGEGGGSDLLSGR